MQGVGRAESQLMITTANSSHRCKVTRLAFPSRNSARSQSSRLLPTAPSASALLHWKRQASLREAKEKEQPQQPLLVGSHSQTIAQHRHNQVMPRREPKRNFETAEGYPRTTIRELVRQLQSQDQNNPERLIQSLRQDLASRKVHSRNEKKCVPAELETRKLEWEGRRVFRPIPYTAVKQEPRRSEQRMTGREQLVRLSGWENEQLKAPLWAGELDF